MDSELDLARYDGHTEGPWSADPHCPIYVWAGEAMVADMPEAGEEAYLARMRGAGRGATSFEQAANARLIADAPLLLAEVRRLREEIEAKDIARDLLRDSLAKNADLIAALRQSHARLLAAAKRTLTKRQSGAHYNECLAGQRGYGQCSTVCEVLKAAVAKAEAL